VQPDREEVNVPTYSYKCRKCKKQYEEVLSLKEYAEGKRTCPKCGSEDVEQVLDVFTPKTSRKA
jgi:putative FmdB family regulatory protein